MPAFTTWLLGPPAGLGDALAARLARDGFRAETIDMDRYAALAAGADAAAALVELVCRRFVAHGVVAVVEARDRPANPWPDLVVGCDTTGAGIDLTVETAGHRAAVAEQILFEARERGLTEPAGGEQAVVDRLRSIGYLG